MAASDNSWQDMFAHGTGRGEAVSVPLRVVSRGGHTFLILPEEQALAEKTLKLYSPQTIRARAALYALKCALQYSLPFKARRVSMKVQMDDPFVHFLQNLAHGNAEQFPAFGVLAGNPGAIGRRFILMVFDDSKKPAAIVKVGLSAEAKQLIEKEAAFLDSVPTGMRGTPPVRGRFEQTRLRALAMGYVVGESPQAKDEGIIPELLTSWIHPQHSSAIGLMRTWWELKTDCSDHPIFTRLEERLANRIVRPAIFHGDFAPWNIKVSDGVWTVLDWERGDLNGLPGYDWFHYIIQTRILVSKKSTVALVRELSSLVDSLPFQKYAARAGIAGVERELAVAYLLHHNEVIRPGEGRVQGGNLLNSLAKQWLGIPGGLSST